jgi:hypothetical protein
MISATGYVLVVWNVADAYWVRTPVFYVEA